MLNKFAHFKFSSQSDYFVQIVDKNLHIEWQTVCVNQDQLASSEAN